MDNLDWISEPRHRRTEAENERRQLLISEWILVNNYRYDPVGELIMPTAAPTDADKHHLSPSEKVLLDYEGRF